MKTYKIGVFEEQSGYMLVKAESEKEAEEIVEDVLNRDGINSENTDIKHREFNVL